MKLEKWIPDTEKFGQYVGYNNGAIWKIGNKGMRSARNVGGFVTVDTSVPKFYTVGTNTMRGNGVTKAIIMDAFNVSPESDGEEAKIVTGTSGDETPSTIPKAPQKPGDSVGEDEESKDSKKEDRKKKTKQALDQFKENAKNVASNLAGSVQSFVVGEINNQILIRSKLLENTINKIKSSLGLSVIDGEKNVYPKPYTPHSSGPWFDVRNELFNFLTEDTANLLANADKATDPNAYPDINKINQYIDDIYIYGCGHNIIYYNIL